MATINADIKRLFKTYSAFLAGTIRSQAALITDTLQWAVHNDDSEAIAFKVSDDSLQCLLAGAQTITGIKTFSTESRFTDDMVLTAGKYFGPTNASGIYFISNGSVAIESSGSKLIRLYAAAASANEIAFYRDGTQVGAVGLNGTADYNVALTTTGTGHAKLITAGGTGVNVSEAADVAICPAPSNILGFFGATGADQAAHLADPAATAEALAAWAANINTILEGYGLMAAA